MEIATHDYDTEDERQVDKLIALMDNGRNDEFRQGKTARVAQLAAMKKVGELQKIVRFGREPSKHSTRCRTNDGRRSIDTSNGTDHVQRCATSAYFQL